MRKYQIIYHEFGRAGTQTAFATGTHELAKVKTIIKRCRAKILAVHIIGKGA